MLAGLLICQTWPSGDTLCCGGRFAVVGGIQRLEDRRTIDYREDFFAKAAFLTVPTHVSSPKQLPYQAQSSAGSSFCVCMAWIWCTPAARAVLGNGLELMPRRSRECWITPSAPLQP